jgi:hypothetical protein
MGNAAIHTPLSGNPTYLFIVSSRQGMQGAAKKLEEPASAASSAWLCGANQVVPQKDVSNQALAFTAL